MISSNKLIRVGIIGMSPGQSWAALSHVPAIRWLANDFEIMGVANTREESAKEAAAAFNIPKVFPNAQALVESEEIDLVVITVKVPHHFELVKAAIHAGKHVYCEWPLGNGLLETKELAFLARSKGVLGIVGTQSRLAPEILYLKQLINQGYVGDILSTTMIGSGGNGWGSVIAQRNAYLLDNKNGASLLTIPVGHALATIDEVLGSVVNVSSLLLNRRHFATVTETGESIPMTTADNILVNATLESGIPVSLHYRGGLSGGTNLLWEINGTEGDIQIKGESGHIQFDQLQLYGRQARENALQPIMIPENLNTNLPTELYARNVAKLYNAIRDDLRNGTRTAPSFDDAVRIHEVIDAIERSNQLGSRIDV